MSRRLPTALSVLVAILVPPLLVVTSLRIVANDWIVHFEYRWGGVPADRYGLTRGERTDLALTGLRSILPGGEGVALLRDARLPKAVRPSTSGRSATWKTCERSSASCSGSTSPRSSRSRRSPSRLPFDRPRVRSSPEAFASGQRRPSPSRRSSV